ncbi:hypothetical protein Tco_0960538 [Tanacetum coccineum]
MSPSIPDPCPKKKANLFTVQHILTLMEEVKGIKEQMKPLSDNSASVSQIGSSKSSKDKQKTRCCKEHSAKIKAQSSQGSSLRKAYMITKYFIDCKYCGFNNHHSDECEYYPGCDIYGSIAHETANCAKKPSLNNRKPRIANR